MSEQKEKKRFDRLVQDSLLSIVAIIVLNVGMFLDIPFEIGFIIFAVGAAVAVLGCYDILLIIKNSKPLADFRANQKGLVYIWFVIAVTVAFMAIVWWVVSYPLWLIIQTMEGIYTYPPEAVGTINLVKNSITWFLAFVVFGCLIFGLVSSFRRVDVQTPYG